jgi:hypothetical protein
MEEKKRRRKKNQHEATMATVRASKKAQNKQTEEKKRTKKQRDTDRKHEEQIDRKMKHPKVLHAKDLRHKARVALRKEHKPIPPILEKGTLRESLTRASDSAKIDKMMKHPKILTALKLRRKARVVLRKEGKPLPDILKKGKLRQLVAKKARLIPDARERLGASIDEGHAKSSAEGSDAFGNLLDNIIDQKDAVIAAPVVLLQQNAASADKDDESENTMVAASEEIAAEAFAWEQNKQDRAATEMIKRRMAAKRQATRIHKESEHKISRARQVAVQQQAREKMRQQMASKAQDRESWEIAAKAFNSVSSGARH